MLLCAESGISTQMGGIPVGGLWCGPFSRGRASRWNQYSIQVLKRLIATPPVGGTGSRSGHPVGWRNSQNLPDVDSTRVNDRATEVAGWQVVGRGNRCLSDVEPRGDREIGIADGDGVGGPGGASRT